MADRAREVLVLGGTGWLGGEVVRQAMAAGHRVSCLARGSRTTPPDGARWVRGDRDDPEVLATAADRDWDLVVDVASQPGQVRTALRTLAPRAARWVFVSTISVYAEDSSDDESAALLPAAAADEVGIEQYGEGKVACELAVCETLERRAVVARLGLLGGPGDPSRRSTHWPHRWAESTDGRPVLLPDVPDAPVQVLDHRDAAAWLLTAGLDPHCHGAHDLAGPRTRFADWQRACREAVGVADTSVACDPQWLADREVAMWMGPRSLPLWLPIEDGWAMRRPCRRAVAAGFVPRDPSDTIGGVLAAGAPDALGDRAGLTRADEAELLAQWQAR